MEKIFVDMDETIIDFGSGLRATPPEILASYPEDERGNIPGLFGKMKPKPGQSRP